MRYLLLLCLPLVAQVQTPLLVYQSSGSLTGEIRLQERRTNGSNHVGLAAPQSVASDLVWTLPATDGTNGQALVTNGAGTLSWATAGGLPVADTSAVVQGSGDATKLLRFEVDGFSTATTRVLTPQDASYTLAGTNVAQTFTANQSVAAQLSVTGGNSMILDRATRGTSQKAYWTVAGSASTTGAWSIGTTPSGAASRFVIDHNGTEIVTIAESGQANFTDSVLANALQANGAVTAARFNATGANSYRVNGTDVIDASRNLVNIGTANIGGVLTLGSTLTADLIPTFDSLFVIGTTLSQWSVAHIDTINAYTAVLPDVDGGADLGSTSKKFANSYLNTVEIYGVIQPDTSNSRNLGANTRRWATTFTQNLNITGTVTAPSGNTGWSGTRTVRAAGGAGDCTLIYSGGILTGGTC